MDHFFIDIIVIIHKQLPEPEAVMLCNNEWFISL